MVSGKCDAAISIDIGGTSAKWALVSCCGEILLRGSFPTGKTCSEERLISEICICVESVLRQSVQVNIRRIAVCLPGVVDPDGIVRGGAPNLPCICNLDFEQRLGSIFGISVVVLNDAKAAALGEGAFGAARDQGDFLFLIYGTGIGGALVLDHRVHMGRHGFAGEVGYSDWRSGRIAEDDLSTLALVRAASEATNTQLDGKMLFAKLDQQDTVIEELFHSWVEANARLIANALLVVDVPFVVIGGGISAQGKRLTEALQTRIRKKLPERLQQVEIVPALLGNDAALLGVLACGA